MAGLHVLLVFLTKAPCAILWEGVQNVDSCLLLFYRILLQVERRIWNLRISMRTTLVQSMSWYAEGSSNTAQRTSAWYTLHVEATRGNLTLENSTRVPHLAGVVCSFSTCAWLYLLYAPTGSFYVSPFGPWSYMFLFLSF